MGVWVVDFYCMVYLSFNFNVGVDGLLILVLLNFFLFFG